MKSAFGFREETHREALAKARADYPAIDTVIDKHPVEDYFTKHWDYPGKWYITVSIPCGYKNRQALVDEIAVNTVDNYLRNRAASSKEPFCTVIA